MNKKMAAMFAATLIALSIVGVGYATWSETLYLDGTVETGFVDVEWSEHGFGAEGDFKLISNMMVSIAGDTLTVKIVDAYPGVTYWVLFDIHCMGSIPVHIDGIPLAYDNGISVSIYDLKVGDVAVESYPVQLHYCQELTGILEITVDQVDSLDVSTESRTFSLDATIDAVQYNLPAE